MPATYAHYRFGVQALELLDPDLARLARRFRRLYDVGLHGPDIFFYYNPVIPTSTGALGTKFHNQTGKAFFGAAVRRLRLHPSDAGTVYLYGVLCHYALDSNAHPTINALSADGKIGHSQLESEFDRYLLASDGKIPPHVQDLSAHLSLSRGECFTVAELYPGASPSGVATGVRHMAAVTKFTASRNRKSVEAVFGLGGKRMLQTLIPRTPDPVCAPYDEELLRLYNRALARFPSMQAQLTALRTSGAELGEDFEGTFG